MRCKFRFVGLLALILSSALAANAEVMDKEPSTLFHWASALLGGIGTIAAWRWRWWGGALVTLFGLLWLYASHLEIQDPFVGPAIRAEAGGGYVTQFYLSALVWLALNGVGVYVCVRTGRATG